MKIPGSAVVGSTKKGATQTTTPSDFIGQARDAQGKMVTQVGDNIKVKLDENAASKIGQRRFPAIRYGTDAQLPERSLSAFARENSSGKMGTFETKFGGSRPEEQVPENAA